MSISVSQDENEEKRCDVLLEVTISTHLFLSQIGQTTQIYWFF